MSQSTSFSLAAAGICKCLITWFKPDVNTEDLNQKDGYQLCSQLFKVKANEILDLVLHHGFTREAVGQLRTLKTKEQGDGFMAKMKKRAREEEDGSLVSICSTCHASLALGTSPLIVATDSCYLDL